MKKVITIFAILVTTSTVMGQVTVDEIQKVQQLWGKGKKALSMDLLKIEGAQQEAFGKVFDSYLVDRQKLGMQRVALIDDLGKNVGALDDAKAKTLVNGFFSNNIKLQKLQRKYFKKFSKVLSPARAAQWAQLESYLDNVVRSEMQDLVPFIEPGKLKKK